MALKYISWISLVLFFTALIAHKVANPDIWYHLAFARRIIDARSFFPSEIVRLVPANYVNFYWLFQLASWLSYQASGCLGLLFLFWILWIVIFYFWNCLSKVNAGESWLSFLVGILALLVCQIRFQERPEIFSFVFIVLDIYFLSRWKKPYALKDILGPLTLTQILWCNCHGYFVFGPALFLLKIISLLLETRRLKTFQDHLFGLIFLVLASMISPFEWNTWRSVYEQWFYLSVGSPWITEIYATPALGLTPWPLACFWIYWAATLALCLAQVKNWRIRFFEISLALTGLYFSFTAVRNVPFVVLFSAPLFAQFQFAKFQSRILRIAGTALTLLLALWVVTGGFFKSTFQPYKFGVGVSDLMFPTKLARRSMAPEGLWFSDGTIGSYLEFFKPELHLYGDSRYMGIDSVEYFQSISEPATFFKVNDREHFAHVVLDVGRSAEIIRSLLRNESWRLSYRDLTTAIFDQISDASSGEKSFTEPYIDQTTGPLFQGEDLSELANGNAAIQWTLIFAESNSDRDLIAFLGELEASPVVPSPILEIAIAYLKVHPQGDVLEKIWALRPKMMALTPQAGALVDQQLAAIKSGTFWLSPQE